MKRVLTVVSIAIMAVTMMGSGGAPETAPAAASSGGPYAALDSVKIKVLNTSLADTPSGKMMQAIAETIKTRILDKI